MQAFIAENQPRHMARYIVSIDFCGAAVVSVMTIVLIKFLSSNDTRLRIDGEFRWQVAVSVFSVAILIDPNLSDQLA